MKNKIYCVLIIFLTISVLAQEKIAEPSIEQIKSKYEKQIKRLEGVTEICLAEKESKELIIIQVNTEQDKNLLDNLLSDRLEGFEVLFEIVDKTHTSETDKNDTHTAPLCFRCVGTKYPKNKGLCSSCGAWTESTSFKLCNKCAKKKSVCARCQRSYKSDE